MKNKFKFIFSTLLTLTIIGCGCSKVYNPELTVSKPVISGDKLTTSLTTQDIYNYISSDSSTVKNKAFITELLKIILKENSGYDKATDELTTVYNYKLKSYFEENFIDSDEYKVNGVFSEELLVANLRAKMAEIGDPVSSADNTSVTAQLGLRYDYSKYIASELDYDLYMQLLKEDYITNNKNSILDNSRSRLITVYSAENLEDMEELVADIFDGEYDSLTDLEETKIEEAKREIGRQYCENLGKPNDYYLNDQGKRIENCTASKNSYDSSLTKFTTCKDGSKCDLNSGLEDQIELAGETKYITEELINKDSTEVLYENLLSQLLRDDLESMLVSDEKMEEAFGNNYASIGSFLVTRTADMAHFNPRDIIHQSTPGGTCYIVLVKIIDSEMDVTSEQQLKDKQKALSKLHSKVGDTSVIMHYVENMNIEILDEELKEAYKGIID